MRKIKEVKKVTTEGREIRALKDKSIKKCISVISVAAAAMLLIVGCSQPAGEAALTQPIPETSLQAASSGQEETSSAEASSSDKAGSDTSEQGKGAQPDTALSDNGQGTSGEASVRGYTGDTEADQESYYRVKAEKDAVDIDIDILEADFRVGKTGREEFISRKAELETKEDELERQENILESAIDLAYYQLEEGLPEGDIQSLISQKYELERRDNELETEEDRLEADYRSGKITRDEYIEQRTQGIREEEELERQDDLLERALERLGYDD